MLNILIIALGAYLSSQTPIPLGRSLAQPPFLKPSPSSPQRILADNNDPTSSGSNGGEIGSQEDSPQIKDS